MSVVGCSNDGRTLDTPTGTMPAPLPTVPIVDDTNPPEPPPELPGATLADPTSPTITATVPASSGPDTVDSSGTAAASDATEATVAPRVIIDAARSPENATAELVGHGATFADPVTVDGEPGDVISFDIADDGTFTVRIWIEEEGAHTVCLGDGCTRLYTLEPDAQTPEEVIALIEEAIPLAQQLVDYPTLFPEWTVEIGGQLSGTGGTTDVDAQVVTIFRNRHRTVDDFVRTIAHEMGHVADYEWLDDDMRAEYLEIRGIAPDTRWRDEGERALSFDQWQLQPSEDFAEVMAMLWSEGEYLPRTDTLAPPPDADQLARVAALVADR